MAQRMQIAGGAGGALDVELAGPPDGAALLFHTGTPSAGTVPEALVALGARRGLRTVSYSRPGYGDSERRPGRSVGDCAADVAAVADALGIDGFVTVGWSGGGPHALACAARLPERTIAAATIAGVAPYDAEGLDWTAGMGAENVEEFEAAAAGEEELLAFVEEMGEGLVHVTAEGIATGLGDLVSAVDVAALDDELAGYLAAAMRRGVANGPWGWLDDDLAFTRDWGFDIAAIERPVTIWQGGEDRMVPAAHGAWLAAHVAGARARPLERDGHISILLACYDDLLDDLLEH